MAAHTGQRRTLEFAVDMTKRTLHGDMRAGQLEGRQVMVKAGGFPGGCVMTCTAVRAQATLVVVIFKVTANTGHRRVLILVGGGMTARAQQCGVLAIQLENVKVIEGGRLPGSCGMAAFAGCAFRSLMHIIRSVAAHTSHGCAFEFAIDMTKHALHCDVRAGQLEGSLVMVKAGGFPGSCVMTCTAARAQATRMGVILLMTTKTGRRRVLVLVGGSVTVLAQQRGMFAVQLEYVKVIEGGRLPGSCGMAAFAGCTFRALMHIIRCMAAHTGHGCALEFAVDMAQRALYVDVRPGQFEASQVMVKAGWFPGSCVMTGTAICSQATFMGIILLMTTDAVAGRILELERRGVTILAQHSGMLAIQLEYIEVVKS